MINLIIDATDNDLDKLKNTLKDANLSNVSCVYVCITTKDQSLIKKFIDAMPNQKYELVSIVDHNNDHFECANFVINGKTNCPYYALCMSGTPIENRLQDWLEHFKGEKCILSHINNEVLVVNTYFHVVLGHLHNVLNLCELKEEAKEHVYYFTWPAETD